ncbi:MAG: HD-GYP domain-containing protein [Bacillota bacterium]|nr:HD-GYP domain-containing protein [Bacillota bacterium]
MKEVLSRCKKKEGFCPVSFKKFGSLFWLMFVSASLAAITLNWLLDSPFLIGLYAFPAVLLAMFRIPFSLFTLLGSVLLGSIFIVHSPEPTLIAVTAAFAALMIIVKRVVWVSSRHYQGKNEQEDLLMNTVFSLAKTIDTRDQYTAFHSSNVADYARSIAKELGLSQRESDAIYLAGLIHDIGKIGTPDSILQKESRLSEEEYDIMKKHPEDGYQIIKNIKRFQELGISDMVRYHHERPDGKGYPAGLKGTEIPLGARILGVADAFDAMTTNRSYRQKLAIETASEELKRYSGTQFDPDATKAFLKYLTREGKLERERLVFSMPQVS